MSKKFEITIVEILPKEIGDEKYNRNETVYQQVVETSLNNFIQNVINAVNIQC